MSHPSDISCWSPTRPDHLDLSVGAVVVSADRSQVLMRHATGSFGGTGWTPLAKGRPDPGESEHAAALREVREEMGAVVEIVGELPGFWLGTTTATRVFLATVVGPLGAHDAETSAVRWASLSEARALVALSPSVRVQARDTMVLARLSESPVRA